MPIRLMKGQELPISTIVLIVLAIIILVLALVLIVLPITKTPTPSSSAVNNITTFTFDCSTYCEQSSGMNVPANTPFCKASVVYPKGGTTYYCWSTYNGKQIATCTDYADNGSVYENLGISPKC